MGSELSRHEMCAWAAARASCLLGCVNRGTARGLRGMIIPHYSAFVRPSRCCSEFGARYRVKMLINWRDFSRGPPRQLEAVAQAL